MQEFPELMRNGRTDEAEALLDRVIALLDVDHDGKPIGGAAGGPHKVVRKPFRAAQLDSQQELFQQMSLEDVRAEVGALKVQDVAWRKIAWKTCLLDGLKASREQKKPIILWDLYRPARG